MCSVPAVTGSTIRPTHRTLLKWLADGPLPRQKHVQCVIQPSKHVLIKTPNNVGLFQQVNPYITSLNVKMLITVFSANDEARWVILYYGIRKPEICDLYVNVLLKTPLLASKF